MNLDRMNLDRMNLDRSIAVVCKGTSCLPPVSVPEKLLKLLGSN